jgi:hypothetical protein
MEEPDQNPSGREEFLAQAKNMLVKGPGSEESPE